jgi:uncharacterized cofD-like protein
LGAVGRVLPATTVPTELRAELRQGSMVGQAAIGREPSVWEVSILPEWARPPQAALEALALAQQVVIGPGSLYTSILAAVAVPGISSAIGSSAARVVFVCNLEAQDPETGGYSVADHVAALERHDVSPDVVLWDHRGGIELGQPQMAAVDADLRGSNGRVHDPAKLAEALAALC